MAIGIYENDTTGNTLACRLHYLRLAHESPDAADENCPKIKLNSSVCVETSTSPSPPPPGDENSDSNDDTTTYIIIGSVAGGVLLIGGLIYFYNRMEKGQTPDSPNSQVSRLIF